MPTVIASRCPQDHTCPLVQMCPAGAISQRGSAAPVINAEKCRYCEACLKNCGQGC